MHECMLREGFEPDAYTFVSLFKACSALSDLESGRKLHEAARVKRFTLDMIVLTAILGMYAKCGALEEAEDIFSRLQQPDVVCWNALLSAYVHHCEGEKALLLYMQMSEENMRPTHQTMVLALQACKCLVDDDRDTEQALELARALHSHARREGLLSHVFVYTNLVSVYGKHGKIAEAENVFTEQLQPHPSLWNAMLCAYVDQGNTRNSLQLFKQMLFQGISPDERTYAVTLQACVTCLETENIILSTAFSTKLICQEIGEALHHDAEVGNFTSSLYVVTTLLSLYGKCGLIAKAEAVFDAFPQHTAISWNALLCVYVDGGHGERAIDSYKQMQLDHVPLDVTSLLSVLQASSEVGILSVSLQLHFAAVSLDLDVDLFFQSALISAYGGCASIEDATFLHHAFLCIASLNACLAGHAMEGDLPGSATLFEETQLSGLMPNGVTYACIISACNHAGLACEAMEYFVAMSSVHNISPDAKHTVSIADLLGRAGDFLRVNSILQRIAKHADLSMWLFLLGACRTHGNVDLAKRAFEYAVDLEPEQATAYVSMSNIYANIEEVVLTESG